MSHARNYGRVTATAAAAYITLCIWSMCSSKPQHVFLTLVAFVFFIIADHEYIRFFSKFNFSEFLKD